MACPSISLLTFVLLASYVSATSIEKLCKGNPDINYCVALLKSSVPQPSDFKSEEWRKKLVNYVLQKAVAIEKFVVDASHKLKGSRAAALNEVCVKSVGNSVKDIKAGDLVMASDDLDSCSDSLEDGDIEIEETSVKGLAKEAAKAIGTAYSILSLNTQNPKIS